MRKAVVSLAAVLMMLASLGSVSAAPPISSSGSNDKVSISIDGPTVVTAGGTARFTGTITLNNDGTSARKPVIFNMALLSEDGPVTRIPLRSGVKTMTAGRTKTAVRSLTINERAKPGQYFIVLDVTVDGETLTVGLPLEIKAK